MTYMNRIYRIMFLLIFLGLQSACTFSFDFPFTTSATPIHDIQQISSTITPKLPTVPTSIITTPLINSNTPSPESPLTVRFAVIGDYGEGNTAEKDVADLILSWNPDLVITTGDNNYPNGAANTIDQRIGQYFHTFIYLYQGIFGTGSNENRYYPSLGNHDWVTDQAQPYLDYFSLPGNERYYQFSRGPVGYFVLDSDAHEPDGVNSGSVQADWLKLQLSKSTATWNIVYFHHPPYSSGLHGSTDWMRWPFKEWGADLVLSGHDHTYERLQIDGLTYIVNGLGGGSIYDFIQPISGSLVRYNQDYGAMLIEADREKLRLQFFNRGGDLIDDATLIANP
jgi:tartrate-resistant acid phosphatase type 5